MVLDVDLNVPLPDINNEVGSSLAPAATQVQVNQRASAAEMVPIDVDAFDDDVVVLSSPRAISEVALCFPVHLCRWVVLQMDMF